jgi:hypothetical protein
MHESADPSGRAIKAVGMRPLGRWDRGFESHSGHGWICHSTGFHSLEAFSSTDLSSWKLALVFVITINRAVKRMVRRPEGKYVDEFNICGSEHHAL